MSTNTTHYSFSVRSIVGTTYSATNAAVDLDLTLHLNEGGIISSNSYHLSLTETRTLIAQLQTALATAEEQFDFSLDAPISIV